MIAFLGGWLRAARCECGDIQGFEAMAVFLRGRSRAPGFLFPLMKEERSNDLLPGGGWG